MQKTQRILYKYTVLQIYYEQQKDFRMNVLVTGAAGFVGTHLVKELTDNNHTVIAAVNHGEKPPLDAQTIHVDLSDKKQTTDSIDFTNIDAVIHLAGLAAVGPSFDEPLKYLSVNAGIEINLYEACITQDARPKMLIISSGTLYDPASHMPLTEDSPLSPSSPYAVSKVAQEVFVEYYKNRNFKSVIARPFNHIGPGQNPGFIVPDFTKQVVAAERGKSSEILVGNLDAKRDYTDVRDIVRAYRLLIEAEGTDNQIFNICSGISIGCELLLNTLLGLSEAKITVKQDASRMRPADIVEIIGDHSKITSITGWEPTYSLEQSLQDALQDWRGRAE